MTTDNLTQIWIDDVTCFVDLRTNEIYSAKLHKMKGQTLEKHVEPHFMIKYQGKKRYMSLGRLIELAKQKAAQAKGE